MSSRRRTRGQDVAKPPKLNQSAESAQISETAEDEVKLNDSGVNRQKGSRGILGLLWSGMKYVLLLIVVLPFINYAALQKENAELKPLGGELYDVGQARKMYLMCAGKGPPTVVLDAPTGFTSDVWSLVWPRLEKHVRVCVYDRAGLGFSDRPADNSSTNQPTADDATPPTQHAMGQPFTAESMTDDLHRLLTSSSRQPTPLILVGSELGSVVSQFYATLFDRDVLGVVLINPLPETLFDEEQLTWSQYWFGQLLPTFQSLQLSAALGVTRLALLLGALKQPLPEQFLEKTVVNRQNYLMCHPRHLSSIVDEHYFINQTFSQMRTLRTLRQFPSDVSVTVMTGNYYDEQLPSSLNKAMAKAQQSLIGRIFPRAQHIVVNAANRHMALTSPEAIAEQVLKMARAWKRRQTTSAQK